MASSAADTEKELGHLAALTLMKEMKFLAERRNTPSDTKLIDPPTERPKFQQVHGEDAAKSDVGRNFLPDLAGLYFCVADGSVNNPGHTDTDHTDPYKRICDKQAALLTYLNASENAKFAEGFLAVDGIRAYIGRDKPDEKIKGTGYFYALCYNDIDNLLLLCHACNMQKGAKESLVWFEAQEPFLGKAFVDTATAAGGLQEGIIIQKIINPDGKPTVKIGDVTCVLHDGKAVGLGAFVDKWFDTKNSGYRKGIIKAYKDVWLELKAIFETRLRQDGAQARQTGVATDKVVVAAQSVVKAVCEHYHIGDSASADGRPRSGSGGSSGTATSSVDSEETKTIRIGNVQELIKKMFTQMHDIKIFHKEIKKKHSIVAIKSSDVFKMLKSCGFYDLGTSAQKDAMEAMKREVTKLDASTAITKEIVEEIIKQAVENNDPAKQAKKEEKARIETERKAEAEAQARIEAEREREAERQRADAEVRARAEAERQAEHQRQRAAIESRERMELERERDAERQRADDLATRLAALEIPTSRNRRDGSSVPVVGAHTNNPLITTAADREMAARLAVNNSDASSSREASRRGIRHWFPTIPNPFKRKKDDES